jgi:small subunit ribosomal protein S9
MKGYKTQAVGRRKEAVARAYLKDGSGEIFVNNLPCDQYFERESLRLVVKRPLKVVGKDTEFDLKLTVVGGGKSGQAGACSHAISRALNALGLEYRAQLKPEGLLTRDSRVVERKKYGRHKARKLTQFSKR